MEKISLAFLNEKRTTKRAEKVHGGGLDNSKFEKSRFLGHSAKLTLRILIRRSMEKIPSQEFSVKILAD